MALEEDCCSEGRRVSAETFPNEASMIQPLVEVALSRWAQRSPDDLWVCVTEHQADTRIADLVLARVDSDALFERLQTEVIRPLTRPELAALAALRADCGTSLALIAERTRVGRQTVIRTLKRLEADGFVERTASNAWTPRLRVRRVVSRFLSFEAKRSDWRRALTQARAHRLFANEAYVAFDAVFARRFEQGKPYFRTAGIGLFGLHADKTEVRQLVPGRSGRPLDAISAALAGEEVLARLLGLRAKPLPQARLPNGEARTWGRATPTLVGAGSTALEQLLGGRALPAEA